MKPPAQFRLCAALIALATGAVFAEEQGAIPSFDSSPHVRRAVTAMRAGQWKTARSAWEEVLLLDSNNAAALSNLGKVQYQLEDYPAARISLEKATTLKPALADSWLTLGMTYLEQKSPMLAVSAMTRGVSENPGDPRAHNSLAIVLKRVGWTNGAESELQKALDIDPEYSEAHFNLAVMYLERKPPSLEMAGRHYRRARELGAAPDELVEKQIRGEFDVVEEDPVETAVISEEAKPVPATGTANATTPAVAAKPAPAEKSPAPKTPPPRKPPSRKS